MNKANVKARVAVKRLHIAGILLSLSLLSNIVLFGMIKQNPVKENKVSTKAVNVSPTTTPTPTPTVKKLKPHSIPMTNDIKKEWVRCMQRKAITLTYKNRKAPMAKETVAIVNMVAYAQEYGLDWRLVPALSIAESNGGKYCFRPYNAYGLMVNKNFKNFNESTMYVIRLLMAYRRAGLVRLEDILRKYNPKGGKKYINDVKLIMKEIEGNLKKVNCNKEYSLYVIPDKLY